MEIASRTAAMDGRRLRDLYETVQPTIMQATPATWRMLIEAGWMGSATDGPLRRGGSSS